MYKIHHLILAAFFVSGFAIAVAGQADWIGAYEFSEDGGRTAGGTAIFIQHDIQIASGDGGLIAFVKSNGYQTSKDLVCIAKVEGGRLNIYFESYGEDNVFESYKTGDLLLTLERKTEKGKTTLLTHWGKFTPVISKNEKSGKTYFTKSETYKNEK